jgi:acyl dehydratase
MAATSFPSVDRLSEAVGSHLGYSPWIEITQRRVDLFAAATDDHQWIHVDVERAAAGPFGGTIAHGYLTLSLAVPLVGEILSVEGAGMVVNYGADRVRFPAPVPVGSRIRAGARLAGVEGVSGGVQVALDVTFELDGSDKPACVARILSRYLI